MVSIPYLLRRLVIALQTSASFRTADLGGASSHNPPVILPSRVTYKNSLPTHPENTFRALHRARHRLLIPQIRLHDLAATV